MGDISRHFSRHEFLCKCGKCDTTTQWVPFELVAVLECIHAITGYEYGSRVTIVVNSGIRCPAHNQAVGGVSSSQHLLGTAADIVVRVLLDGGVWEQVPPGIIAGLLDEIFPNRLGIGIYNNFNHVDVRSQRARWKR